VHSEVSEEDQDHQSATAEPDWNSETLHANIKGIAVFNGRHGEKYAPQCRNSNKFK